MLFSLRFDFRNPAIAATSMAERYAAALDMVEWADALGCVSVGVSEHHGSADGYLPSALPMLAAMAQRSTSARLGIAALLAPFHDPLRLAEDIAVVDNLSKGRVDIILAGGYAREEFGMFGVDMRAAQTHHGNRQDSSGRFHRSAVQLSWPNRASDTRALPARGTENRDGRRERAGGPAGGTHRRRLRAEPSRRLDLVPRRDASTRQARPGPLPRLRHGKHRVGGRPKAGMGGDGTVLPPRDERLRAWQAQDNISSPYHTVDSTQELLESGRYRVITPDQLVSELQTSPVTVRQPPPALWRDAARPGLEEPAPLRARSPPRLSGDQTPVT